MTETVLTEAAVDFNPFAPEMASDPYPHYKRLRERAPVSKSRLGFWYLTRHEDLQAFFSDRTLRREYEAGQRVRMGETVVEQEYFQLFHRMMFVLDAPDHLRVRRLVKSAFTPGRVDAMRGHAEEIAHDLVDSVAAAREMDLVADFASKLPKRVIGRLLGVPEEDHLMVGAWADGLASVFEFLPMDAQTLADANATCKSLYEYFSALAAQRLDDPRDDLLTAMVQAHTTDDGRLDHDELVSNAVLLYAAGQETTAGAIGLSVLSLHRYPDQLAALRADPSLMPAAADELLRFDHPAQATIRITTQPTAFGEHEIPAGEGIVAFLGAALRDPAAFPDPDTLDLRRDLSGRPVFFGGGAAKCLGQHLARAEMQVALATLLERCPEMSLDTLDPPYKPSPVIRGPAELRVTW